MENVSAEMVASRVAVFKSAFGETEREINEERFVIFINAIKVIPCFSKMQSSLCHLSHMYSHKLYGISDSDIYTVGLDHYRKNLMVSFLYGFA